MANELTSNNVATREDGGTIINSLSVSSIFFALGDNFVSLDCSFN